MYAQLGSTRFEGLKGFSSFSKSVESSLAEHALIDGKPRLQRIGDGLVNIDFGMVLHQRFTTPAADLSTLETARANGDILPLVSGSGDFLGNFVIRSLSHNTVQQADDGSIIECEVSVSLIESVTSSKTANTGFAAAPGRAEPISPLPSISYPAERIAAEVASAYAKAKQVDTSVQKAQSNASFVQKAYNDAKRIGKSIQENVEKARGLINKAQSIYDKTRVLESNLNTIYQNASQVQQFAEVEDLNGLISASRNMSQSADRMNSSATTVVGIAAFRKPS